MSDLDRNYTSPFGRAAGRADAATVDAGLRSYMLKVYNYMAIGLAITGLAALGVYMGAVTPDASAAAGRIGKQYLTSFGVAISALAGSSCRISIVPATPSCSIVLR